GSSTDIRIQGMPEQYTIIILIDSKRLYIHNTRPNNDVSVIEEDFLQHLIVIKHVEVMCGLICL
ncbi:MAG: hypothetical protein ACEY3J_02025, partial [Arsenophonus sp.]